MQKGIWLESVLSKKNILIKEKENKNTTITRFRGSSGYLSEEERMDKLKEDFNKETEDLKRNQSEMINTMREKKYIRGN